MGHEIDPLPSEPISSILRASASTPRRQRRGSEMRAKRWNVRASAEDAEVILGKAERAGVSVPRLLVSLAVGGVVRSSVERKATVATLVGLKRQLAGVGTNLNQLAYHANAMGELPEVDRLGEAVALVEMLGAQLESVLAEVELS